MQIIDHIINPQRPTIICVTTSATLSRNVHIHAQGERERESTGVGDILCIVMRTSNSVFATW